MFTQVGQKKKKTKIPRKCHYKEAQPSWGTKRRRDEEQTMTKQMKTTVAERKKNCKRGVNLEQLVEKTTGVLKPVLFLWNITFNSDAFPNYKHMFSLHKGPLPHQWNSTVKHIYRIWPNYCTYPYKRTVKQFHSLQIIASVLFVCFFIKAYFVDTHLNCIDKSMQFKWVPTAYAFIKRRKNTIIA